MVKFLWPFVIVICAVRAIIMIVELQRGCVTLPLFLSYCRFLAFPSLLGLQSRRHWRLEMTLYLNQICNAHCLLLWLVS